MHLNCSKFNEILKLKHTIMRHLVFVNVKLISKTYNEMLNALQRFIINVHRALHLCT